jgi:hypothetical protein
MQACLQAEMPIYRLQALRRAGTGPDQDSRVARAKKILAEPVVKIDHGLFILPESKWKEVNRL